jgi:hypothetical protein
LVHNVGGEGRKTLPIAGHLDPEGLLGGGRKGGEVGEEGELLLGCEGEEVKDPV